MVQVQRFLTELCSLNLENNKKFSVSALYRELYLLAMGKCCVISKLIAIFILDILSILGDKKDGILNMKLDEAVKLEVIYLFFI